MQGAAVSSCFGSLHAEYLQVARELFQLLDKSGRGDQWTLSHSLNVSFLLVRNLQFITFPPGTIDRYLGEGVLAQLSAVFSSTTSTSTQRLTGHSLSQPTTKLYSSYVCMRFPCSFATTSFHSLGYLSFWNTNPLIIPCFTIQSRAGKDAIAAKRADKNLATRESKGEGACCAIPQQKVN